ncbi:hypothetical protein QTG54_001533 [Skeletonema marinoi]|uniref:Uncharacterized protein n=1 Tax=Skeletonema marinoi TaxID=267567 RepID=A0AAD9DJ38_9STRA|nr:hypothetical protein QTG54_001533 [Skeletonema marinoi]
MTTMTKLLALLYLPAAICASINPRARSTAFLSDAQKSALLVRGGDLGPISGEALAKTFGVLAIGDAIGGTVRTAELYDKFHITVLPGSNGEHYMGHGIASSAASLAVTSLLALTGTTSVEEAVGFGMLARSAYMTEMLLTGKYKELGVPAVPHVIVYLLLLGTAFGLLSGNADGVTLAKVVSVILAGHGGLLCLNPRIDEDDDTKQMAKVDGGYMFVSSLYSAILAFGVDPVKAMGYAAIGCLPLFVSFIGLVADDAQVFGLNSAQWTFVVVLFIGASAFGMLT